MQNSQVKTLIEKLEEAHQIDAIHIIREHFNDPAVVEKVAEAIKLEYEKPIIEAMIYGTGTINHANLFNDLAEAAIKAMVGGE